MSEADFARYVQQAQNCLEEAGRATREVDKEAWLKLGEEWMEMARKAQRERPPSISRPVRGRSRGHGGTESA
jgi:hypothetical protein